MARDGKISMEFLRSPTARCLKKIQIFGGKKLKNDFVSILGRVRTTN